jgi:hypothetical protein
MTLTRHGAPFEERLTDRAAVAPLAGLGGARSCGRGRWWPVSRTILASAARHSARRRNLMLAAAISADSKA